MYEVISSHMTKQPDSFCIVASDLKLHQHGHISTRESNTLDNIYMNIPGSYKAFLPPHFGLSDHISLLLLHSQLLNGVKLSVKYGQMKLQQLYRTALSAQTGTCSDRLAPKRTTSVLKNIHQQFHHTLYQHALLMMWW